MVIFMVMVMVIVMVIFISSHRAHEILIENACQRSCKSHAKAHRSPLAAIDIENNINIIDVRCNNINNNRKYLLCKTYLIAVNQLTLRSS